MLLQSSFRMAHLVLVIVIATRSISAGDERGPRRLLVVDETAAADATIDELKPDWSILVGLDGVRKEVKRSDYVLWGSYSDQDRSPQVLLTDGTVLVGDIARIDAESITAASRLWGQIRIDRRLVRACLMLPAAMPLERDRQWHVLRTPQPTDRVWLLSGDRLAGRVLPTTERDGGGLFGLASIGVELSDSGTRTSLSVEGVQAIVFESIMPDAPQPECRLGFRDGSLVAASTLAHDDPGVIQIRTAAGARLSLPTDQLHEHLTYIQPQNERVTFLSDLPAIGYKSIPFLELKWPFGIDANTLGGRLRHAGNVVFKGLGMHSASRVVYELDGKYKRFEAELALDDQAQRQGSVVYRVLVEREMEAGQRAWNLALTSPAVRGGDAPLSVSLDVTDATRIALVVEMADRIDTRDYANWLNARLVAP